MVIKQNNSVLFELGYFCSGKFHKGQSLKVFALSWKKKKYNKNNTVLKKRRTIQTFGGTIRYTNLNMRI